MPFTPESSQRCPLFRLRSCGGWPTGEEDSASPREPPPPPLPFSETVGFAGIVDDSNDSFMHFVSPSRADEADQTMDWELARPRFQLGDVDEGDGDDDGEVENRIGRVLFRASPSEPVRRPLASDRRGVTSAASMPPKATATASRTSFKRPSPVTVAAAASASAIEDVSDDAKPCGGGSGGTPKRRRVSRPLGDVTNSASAVTPPPAAFKKPSQPPAELHRCLSEAARVDRAIASIDSLNLIGNCEQRHSLPTVQDLNYGIRHVTAGTVSQLVNGAYADTVANYAIIDCRYPYEFNGGHIQGAINIYTQEDLLNLVFEPACQTAAACVVSAPFRVLIFHCEFSSERAPKLARFLRQRDRDANASAYPELYFPEVYVLQGGYKAFYEAHKSDCQPVNYVKMIDPGFKSELAHHQRVSKAWERQNSRSRHTQLARMMSETDRLL